MAKNTYEIFRNRGLRSSLLTLASCLILSGVPQVADAAGLGKVAVQSALGQPLRAEVEVFATREELSGMRVQLASVDAFRQAGLDYATTLLSIKFVIDKRANGQPIIKLSSDKPINDPFIDMLLELNWSSGRLLREYTFLLDPPEVPAKVTAPVAPTVAVKPPAAVVSNSKPAVEPRAVSPLDNKPLAQSETANARAQQEIRNAVDVKPEATVEGAMHAVKRGETLRQIANETKTDNVSLEQMLVALLRANPDAFDGGNMNRLRAGRILSVPEKSAVEAISATEAKKIVVAQSTNWTAYRSKLATVAAEAPVKESASKQSDAGKVTAKVEDKAAPALASRDQVKVSRTDAATAKRSEEELTAKNKALNEANDRLASLEKNVADLQKLLELKNQNLAELQKQAVGKAAPQTPPVPLTPPAEAKKTAESVPVAEVNASPEQQASVPPPAVAPEPVAAPAASPAPAEPVVEPASAEAKPPVPKPRPKPAPIVETPPEPEAMDWVQALLEKPMLLAGGGGGIVALLAAYMLYKRRRSRVADEAPMAASSTRLPTMSGLTANSIFRETGGHSVNTAQISALTDFSQAGPGSIDTDEVDPVAEADVYMAYGRDAQAEEILLEARQKDPKRHAITVKLLEIYANRKNVKQFDVLAAELHKDTGGKGAEWDKAVALGVALDPQNPLFGGSGQAPAPQAFSAEATVIVSAQELAGNTSTVVMPGQLSQMAAAATNLSDAALNIPNEVAAPARSPMDLDFDLGADTPDAPLASAADAAEPMLANTEAVPAVDAGALDFNIDALPESATSLPEVDFSTATDLDFNLPALDADKPSVVESASSATDVVLDFDLEMDAAPEKPSSVQMVPDIEIGMPAPAASADAMTGGNPVLDFDLELPEASVSAPTPQSAQAPMFDMASINLDLGAASPKMLETSDVSALENTADKTVVLPNFAASQAETVVSSSLISDAVADFDVSPDEESATKLDLAKAYQEMGDIEGARELLQEVLKEGNAAQQQSAQTMLNSLIG